MVVRKLPNAELTHHGIKGQKWGVRRYQNADGSLTMAGKARYTINERKKSLATVSTMSDDELRSSINRMNLEKQYISTTEENIRNSKQMLNKSLRTIGNVAIGTAITLGSAYVVKQLLTNQNNAKKAAEVIKNMTSDELEDKLNRLKKEKEYANLVNDAFNNSNSFMNNALTISAKTVLTTALTGAMAYSLNAAISGKVDPGKAAMYIAPSPKKNK